MLHNFESSIIKLIETPNSELFIESVERSIRELLHNDIEMIEAITDKIYRYVHSGKDITEIISLVEPFILWSIELNSDTCVAC